MKMYKNVQGGGQVVLLDGNPSYLGSQVAKSGYTADLGKLRPEGQIWHF